MTAEMVKALADLAWPLLAIVVLFALLPTVKRVAQSRGFTIKYGQMEVSVQDASEQIRRQIEDLQKTVQMLQRPQQPAREPAAPNAVPTPSRTILWVDDAPEGNAHEMAKLHDDGWEISTVKATTEAIGFLTARTAPPTAVISDMGRREGLIFRRTAGLDLIREMRSRNISSPIFIYTSRASVQENEAKVRALGGSGITASPLELFAMVEHA